MDVERRQAQLPPKSYNFHRRLRRYICSLPIRVQRFLRFGPVITRGLSLDISMQGMSGLICGAPPVGETVAIELFLSGAPLEILATVRYSSAARSGFQFYPLSTVAEQAIREWLLELEKQERSSSPYPFLVVGGLGKRWAV